MRSRAFHAHLPNSCCDPALRLGANVEEGQAAQSKPDFIAKYSIARKEARETHYWLRLLAASDVLPENRLAKLTDEANQLIAILTTIIKKAKETKE